MKKQIKIVEIDSPEQLLYEQQILAKRLRLAKLYKTKAEKALQNLNVYLENC